MTDTTKETIERARESIQALGNVPSQTVALSQMTVPELVEKYRELYGEPTRTRNKAYLLKRLKWRIQELSEGGLSVQARARVQELGDEFPERWRMRQVCPSPAPEITPPPVPAVTRDPRLPPHGTIITKTFGDTVHRITVLEDGFGYEGQVFKSLSAIARKISGTNWNGYAFFNLAKVKP